MIKKIALLIPVLAMVAGAALADPAAPPTTAAQQKADPEVRKLLLLMDKNQNGKVSRDEFMAFMSAEFDRLDLNKDGELDVKELTALKFSTRHAGGVGSK